MIYDHIKNAHLYKGLSAALDTGLEYIETLKADVEIGTYMLENGVKAIVSEGTTRLVNEKGFEAHKRFIDIQLALRGTELIRCKPLEFVKETIPYNPERTPPVMPMSPALTPSSATVTSWWSSPTTPTNPSWRLTASPHS